MNRRKFLSVAKAGLGGGLLANGCANERANPFAITASEIQLPDESAPPLAELAADAGLIYGAGVTSLRLGQDPAFAAAVAQECAAIVSGLDMKWEALRPSPGAFDFSKADAFVEFAVTHNLLLRGHTLMWHADLPSWVGRTLNAHNAKRHMLQHINTVVGRYPGMIHSWDVVNEAVAPEDGEVTGMRRSFWYELLGPDYVELAFRAAAEADPDAILVYNEARLDYATREHERCRVAVLLLMERLLSRGVPVHAIGIQAHLDATEQRFDGVRLQTFLQALADLGLDIFVTELDVSEQGLQGTVRERDAVIASVYRHYLDVVLEVPAVKMVITWGLSDRYTWLRYTLPRVDGAPTRPLPLDVDLRRKRAWQAIADAFARRARHMARNAANTPTPHSEWRGVTRRLAPWRELHDTRGISRTIPPPLDGSLS